MMLIELSPSKYGIWPTILIQQMWKIHNCMYDNGITNLIIVLVLSSTSFGEILCSSSFSMLHGWILYSYILKVYKLYMLRF